ncbi:ribosomal protein S18 acetylase RimI-like enzyme [Chryseobacterium sp. H1D6B]|uniref:GNAT family N-acetyltransferase n=1 Tax=Chryseobacterium sp. H1D6B TaxID=2940588 RepID=UPI0015CB7DA1|nr:GNAT family N-acetyltransferase [Chryseobacterium sp. H1D6B]MDH6252994.1 ribosomal protein S18 acetylase RimI-like enzyme [Chryseobacterium sp. H1D6B]
MEIEYRKLLPHESKMYRAVRLESLEKFPAAFGADYQESLKIEKFRLENDIENPVQERFVMGAFNDTVLAGICVFVKEENNSGSIYQMYVKENYQGRNIGLDLIQAVINEAENRFNGVEIFLEVKTDNVKAYQLYKKFGFQEVIIDDENNINITMKYAKKLV